MNATQSPSKQSPSEQPSLEQPSLEQPLTLHIATDGSYTRGHGSMSLNSGMASFVALEDKIAFFDPISSIQKSRDNQPQDQSFVPEFAALVQAAKYAEMRIEDGTYDNAELYTDNKAALAVTKYVLTHGPLNMYAMQDELKNMISDPDVHTSCVAPAGGIMSQSPLRHIFTREKSNSKRQFKDINDLAARIKQRHPDAKHFHFEHVKAHNEHAVSRMEPRDAMKTRLNSMADTVATKANSPSATPQSMRALGAQLNKEMDGIMFEYGLNPGWTQNVEAGVERYSPDPEQLDIVGNAAVIDDEKQVLKSERKPIRQMPVWEIKAQTPVEIEANKPAPKAPAPKASTSKKKNSDIEIDF